MSIASFFVIRKTDPNILGGVRIPVELQHRFLILDKTGSPVGAFFFNNWKSCLKWLPPGTIDFILLSYNSWSLGQNIIGQREAVTFCFSYMCSKLFEPRIRLETWTGHEWSLGMEDGR